MKLVNYDTRTLIMQNVRAASREPLPDRYTKSRYGILCNLIIRKKIQKRFFDFIISELYGTDNWKRLNYKQMYELIHILTFYNYTEKRRMDYHRNQSFTLLSCRCP